MGALLPSRFFTCPLFVLPPVILRPYLSWPSAFLFANFAFPERPLRLRLCFKRVLNTSKIVSGISCRKGPAAPESAPVIFAFFSLRDRILLVWFQGDAACQGETVSALPCYLNNLL